MAYVLRPVQMADQSADGSGGGWWQPSRTMGSLLHEAVEAGNAALVEELVAAGADLEAPNVDGKRPLHLAISREQDEILDILISRKCDVDAVVTSTLPDGTKVHISPLGLAVSCRSSAAVQVLIRAGADVNAKNSGVTPLYLCGLWNMIEPAAILLDNQAKIDETRGGMTALYAAVECGNWEIAHFLLSRGASVNIYSMDHTPLLLAIYKRDLNMVKLLVRHGADVNLSGTYMESPLVGSVVINNAEILEFLLANGASVKNVECSLMNTILSISNNAELFKILLKNGLVLDERMNATSNPLHAITSESDTEVIQSLLDRNVKFNSADKYNLYPVHYAALAGHVDAVQLLIDKGVSVDCCGYNNWTPLHLAAGSRYGNLVQFLIERGADVNKTDTLRRSALDLALTGLPSFPRLKFGRPIVSNEFAQCVTGLFRPDNTSKTVSGNAVKVDLTAVATILIRNGALIDVTIFDSLQHIQPNSQALLTTFLKAYTDLYRGIADKQDNLVKASIDNGAFVDCVVHKLGTPLTYACKKGSSQIAETLLASGANPNLKAENGMTPLHFAALVGDENLVISLLWKGAIYDAQNSLRRKPIYYAKKAKHAFIAALLRKVDDLYESAKNGDLGILRSLTVLKSIYVSKRSVLKVDKSKCINQLNLFFVIKNSGGQTVAQVAQANNNSMFVHYLWDVLQIQ